MVCEGCGARRPEEQGSPRRDGSLEPGGVLLRAGWGGSGLSGAAGFHQTFSNQRATQHPPSIILVISSRAEKITAALSPSIPAGKLAGAPVSAPAFLEAI